MTIPQFTGNVRFKVAGQSALPKWMQTALKDALDKADAPPESLRFQCRIATDAHENLALIKLNNGETLTIHPKARPQFGKNRDGLAYLTATMTYSGDGETYSLRWIGDNVPQRMQEVAVKHDKGLSVKPAIINLDISAAQVTPAWKANGHQGPANTIRNYAGERALRDARAAVGISTRVRAKRNCARLTDEDIERQTA